MNDSRTTHNSLEVLLVPSESVKKGGKGKIVGYLLTAVFTIIFLALFMACVWPLLKWLRG